jgi:hypothetical protein
MPTYSAADIIGKNLFAKKTVNLYRGNDFVNPFLTIPKGAFVGKVESYLNSGAGRAYLIWQFMDTGNKNYYAKHIPGDLELQEFSGATSLEQQQQEAEEAAQTTGDKVFSLVQKIAVGGALLFLAVTAIKSNSSNK